MVIRRVVLSTRFAVFAAMLLLVAMQWRPLAFLLCAAAAAVVVVRHSIGRVRSRRRHRVRHHRPPLG